MLASPFPAGDHDSRWPKQSILQFITAAHLPDNVPFRDVVARFLGNRFVQIGIKFLALSFDRLEPATEGEPRTITPQSEVGRAWVVGARSPSGLSVHWQPQGEQP